MTSLVAGAAATVIVALTTGVPPAVEARISYEPCEVNVQPAKVTRPEADVGLGFSVQEKPPAAGTDVRVIESASRGLPNLSAERTIGCWDSAVPAVAEVLGSGS